MRFICALGFGLENFRFPRRLVGRQDQAEDNMKLCRFLTADDQAVVGLSLDDATVLDLSTAGVERLESVLEHDNPARLLRELTEDTLRAHLIQKVQLLAPVDHQEVWAAGVTYLRSKKARMEESDFSATAYDKVYEAARPELFFKSLP